jgi:hypothetical protein
VPNLWKRFENLITPPAPRLIGTVLQVYANGDYLVEILPTGDQIRVTGAATPHSIGARVFIEWNEAIGDAPAGAVVVLEV